MTSNFVCKERERVSSYSSRQSSTPFIGNSSNHWCQKKHQNLQLCLQIICGILWNICEKSCLLLIVHQVLETTRFISNDLLQHTQSRGTQWYKVGGYPGVDILRNICFPKRIETFTLEWSHMSVFTSQFIGNSGAYSKFCFELEQSE